MTYIVYKYIFGLSWCWYLLFVLLSHTQCIFSSVHDIHVLTAFRASQPHLETCMKMMFEWCWPGRGSQGSRAARRLRWRLPGSILPRNLQYLVTPTLNPPVKSTINLTFPIHLYTYTYILIYLYTYTYIYIIYTHICIYIYIMYIIFIYMHVYTHACMYLFIC